MLLNLTDSLLLLQVSMQQNLLFGHMEGVTDMNVGMLVVNVNTCKKPRGPYPGD